MNDSTFHMKDILEARTLLEKYLKPTRLLRARSLETPTGAEVWLKLESENHTGSFKVRGALNALLRRSARGPLEGIVTSSTGNHGAAVAYAAREIGLQARIFLPQNPNPVKRDRIAQLGAEIVEAGRDLVESRAHAAQFSRERGWPLIEDVDDPNIAAGAATISCEIFEQLPETGVIVVPVGDSCLIRGIALAAKHLHPKIRIVGVQAEGAPAYFRSWKEHRSLHTDSVDTIADGLATRTTTEENVRELGELVDDMLLVSDDEMLRAIHFLQANERVTAEPAGAAATAALLKSGREFTGKKVVLLVTGANIPPEIQRRAAQMGATP